MTTWAERSNEERALLNPGFCATLLWHAAISYAGVASEGLSFEESFLVLPFVLHRDTREALPHSVRTSLAVWLDENPLSRGRVTTRASFLVPFTKEGLTFGGVHRFIRLIDGRLLAEPSWRRAVKLGLTDSSDEVKDCAKRAGFIGKWFAQAGSGATVLALVGVRP